MADPFRPLFVEVDVERIKAQEAERRTLADVLQRLAERSCADLMRDIARISAARIVPF